MKKDNEINNEEKVDKLVDESVGEPVDESSEEIKPIFKGINDSEEQSIEDDMKINEMSFKGGFNPTQGKGTQNNVAQKDGIQNNHFSQDIHYHMNDSKDKADKTVEYEIEKEELERISFVYVPEYTFCDKRNITDIYGLFEEKNIVAVLGDRKSGRFTFSKFLAAKSSSMRVVCIKEINIELLTKYELKKNTIYIIRNPMGISKLESLKEIIDSKLKKYKSKIFFIFNQDDYEMINNLFYESFISVKVPCDKNLFLLNHIRYYIYKNPLKVEISNTIEEITNSLHNAGVEKKLESINNTIDLHKAASRIIMSLSDSKIDNAAIELIIEQIKMGKSINYLFTDDDTIQDKLFLFVLSCVNGIEKDLFYSLYIDFQQMLLPRLSKKEQKDITKNKLWNKTWSERLSKANSKEVSEERHGYYGIKKITTLQLVNEYEAEQIFNYFIKEYGWNDEIKNWLINQILVNNVKSQECFYTLIDTLAYLAEKDLEDIVKTFISKINDKFLDYYALSKFLRHVYNNYQDQNLHKQVLKLIHRLLTSHNSSQVYMGVKICRYQFSDIYLPRLFEDLLNCYFKFNESEVRHEIIYCIKNMIYYQEEFMLSDKSYFNKINSNNKIWVEKDTEFVYRLMYMIVAGYPNSKEFKANRYPTILYIFGKNIETRVHIVNFIAKSISNHNTYENAIAMMGSMYIYVLENEKNETLKKIYDDLSSRIKNNSQYCKKMLEGHEKAIKMLV